MYLTSSACFEVYMLNAQDQMPDFPQEPYPTFEVRCWALMLDLNLNLILVYCDLLKPTFARRTRSGPTKSGKNGWAIWGSRWVTAGKFPQHKIVSQHAVFKIYVCKIHFKQVINLIGDKFHVQPCRSTNAAQDLDQCLDMQALAGQQWKHMKHRQWFSLHQSISFTYIE